MANTRFKTENSLYVTGETDAIFDTQSTFNANVTVNSAVMIVNGALIVGNTALGITSDLTVTGDLLVAGNLQYTNTQVAGDLSAASDGLALGNTVSRFDGFFRNIFIYNTLNPSSNAVGTQLGNSTSRWVITANSISLSSGITATGNLVINTDAFVVNASSKQIAVNTSVLSGALNVNGGANVTGDIRSTANVNANLVRAGNSYVVMNTATITTNTSVIVDQFANAGVKTVRYTAHAQNLGADGYYAVEILGLNSNGVLLVTQYGEVNNIPLGTFNLIKSGANLQLTYIDTVANTANSSSVTVLRAVML
jgi:hypothetical protein